MRIENKHIKFDSTPNNDKGIHFFEKPSLIQKIFYRCAPVEIYDCNAKNSTRILFVNMQSLKKYLTKNHLDANNNEDRLKHFQQMVLDDYNGRTVENKSEFNAADVDYILKKDNPDQSLQDKFKTNDSVIYNELTYTKTSNPNLPGGTIIRVEAQNYRTGRHPTAGSIELYFDTNNALQQVKHQEKKTISNTMLPLLKTTAEFLKSNNP